MLVPQTTEVRVKTYIAHAIAKVALNDVVVGSLLLIFFRIDNLSIDLIDFFSESLDFVV